MRRLIYYIKSNINITNIMTDYKDVRDKIYTVQSDRQKGKKSITPCNHRKEYYCIIYIILKALLILLNYNFDIFQNDYYQLKPIHYAAYCDVIFFIFM